MLKPQASAQRWLGTWHILAGDLDLRVEVKGLEIVVTARDGFRVTYRRSSDAPELVLTSEWVSSDTEKRPIRLAELRARAWRLANDTAIELGWY